MEKKLVLNRWKTPDGTILISRHGHDYVSHDDENGEYYFVDGGNDYVRMSSNKEPMEDMCVYSDAPFVELRKYIFRGTFDNDGIRIWIPICNMSNEHLESVLTYNFNRGYDFSTPTMRSYANELIYRFEECLYRTERFYDKKDETPYDDYIEMKKNYDAIPKTVEDFDDNYSEYITYMLEEGYDSTNGLFISALRMAVQEGEQKENNNI